MCRIPPFVEIHTYFHHRGKEATQRVAWILTANTEILLLVKRSCALAEFTTPRPGDGNESRQSREAASAP